ncbi:MAG TPA: hypothetical protein VFE79_18420 [Paraburkholderia sp.]|jgi:hypothetical protein|nr:hypothetical protein [Paraburkholderia sp.]
MRYPYDVLIAMCLFFVAVSTLTMPYDVLIATLSFALAVSTSIMRECS